MVNIRQYALIEVAFRRRVNHFSCRKQRRARNSSASTTA